MPPLRLNAVSLLAAAMTAQMPHTEIFRSGGFAPRDPASVRQRLPLLFNQPLRLFASHIGSFMNEGFDDSEGERIPFKQGPYSAGLSILRRRRA